MDNMHIMLKESTVHVFAHANTQSRLSEGQTSNLGTRNEEV